MRSQEYRNIISSISKGIMRKHFPGLKQKQVCECVAELAKNIHARMYGANVEGVDSPIWHARTDAGYFESRPEPKINASEILKQE